MQEVFSGKPYYANKKKADLEKRGYTVVRKREWSDGSITYVMEYKIM